jgi:Ser/Thr protein kinase RdoA (MazF antagonist)
MNVDDLSEWVAASYGMARPVTCELLRSHTNDVYTVRSQAGRFVLKLYGSGWRTEHEIRYEVALIRHLRVRGLPVANTIPGSSHDVLQTVETPGGRRHAVLYEYAPGEKPRPPFTLRLYEAFGRGVARMHHLSDGFASKHRRSPVDLSLLLDEPLALAERLARPEDQGILMEAAGRVKERMTELAAEGLDWGPIHGDATLDNLHVTAGGEVVLYDFDSGGPGWRAADLQGWAAGSTAHREKWEAFLRGYSSIRPINPADLLAAPYLTVAWDIWGLQIDLENRILRRGRERTEAYLQEHVALIRERMRWLAGQGE